MMRQPGRWVVAYAVAGANHPGTLQADPQVALVVRKQTKDTCKLRTERIARDELKVRQDWTAVSGCVVVG